MTEQEIVNFLISKSNPLGYTLQKSFERKQAVYKKAERIPANGESLAQFIEQELRDETLLEKIFGYLFSLEKNLEEKGV